MGKRQLPIIVIIRRKVGIHALAITKIVWAPSIDVIEMQPHAGHSTYNTFTCSGGLELEELELLPKISQEHKGYK